MSFFEYFFPDYSFRNVNEIDMNILSDCGIRYAILDIDNTLVPYTSPEPDENALRFLDKLKENGIKYCFVSNNGRERLEIFNKKIGASIYSNAKKPLLCGINSAMCEFGAKESDTVLIGDQIFTDILGGKRAGLLTVLVEPIKEVDTLFFRFKRYFEKIIIKKYKSYKRK